MGHMGIASYGMEFRPPEYGIDMPCCLERKIDATRPGGAKVTIHSALAVKDAGLDYPFGMQVLLDDSARFSDHAAVRRVARRGIQASGTTNRDRQPMPETTPLSDWFSQVVAQNYRLFYSIAFSMLRNPADAEDAVQDGVLRAYRSIGSLSDPGAAVGWIARIVRNCAIDRIRRSKDQQSLDNVPAEPAVEAGGEHADVRELLLDEIANLSEGLANVIMLRFFEGLDADQIAVRLQLTSNTARVRLHRGLECLRRSPRLAALAEASRK
jgi:RNA polymerase sigma factor (sigma-70 family)